MLNGIPKIKNAGAENRAFAKWAERYVKVAKHTYMLPMIVKLNTTINLATTLLGTFFMYYKALDAHVNVEDGTYEELVEKGGFFAELVERQWVDVD